MKYDFDKLTDRRHTDSYKWDDEPDVLPLWVADMDFQTAPCITEALQKRVEQGIFGYTKVPESYYQAIIGWFKRRHQWQIEREWILYTSGVVPALSCALKAMTLPGEKVLVQTRSSTASSQASKTTDAKSRRTGWYARATVMPSTSTTLNASVPTRR
jgi:cystathionine beta-lyase